MPSIVETDRIASYGTSCMSSIPFVVWVVEVMKPCILPRRPLVHAVPRSQALSGSLTQARPQAVPRFKAAASRGEEDWSLGAASASAAAETAQQHSESVEGDDTADDQFEDFFNFDDEDEAGGPAVQNAAVDITDDEDSRSFAVAMAREAWDTKAEDTLVLHVAPLVYWTRYMVICTVFSKPQLNALLARMTQQAKDAFGRELSHSVEGRSAWELLDYGDVVVHIMTADQRDYYDLEGFYGAAEEVDLPFLQGGSQQQQGLGWQKRLA